MWNWVRCTICTSVCLCISICWFNLKWIHLLFKMAVRWFRPVARKTFHIFRTWTDISYPLRNIASVVSSSEKTLMAWTLFPLFILSRRGFNIMKLLSCSVWKLRNWSAKDYIMPSMPCYSLKLFSDRWILKSSQKLRICYIIFKIRHFLHPALPVLAYSNN